MKMSCRREMIAAFPKMGGCFAGETASLFSTYQPRFSELQERKQMQLLRLSVSYRRVTDHITF